MSGGGPVLPLRGTMVAPPLLHAVTSWSLRSLSICHTSCAHLML